MNPNSLKTLGFVFCVFAACACTPQEEGEYRLRVLENAKSTDEINFPAQAWRGSVLQKNYSLSLRSTASVLQFSGQREPNKLEREGRAISFTLVEADELLAGELRFSGTLQGNTVTGSLSRVWNLSGNHVQLTADVTFEKIESP